MKRLLFLLPFVLIKLASPAQSNKRSLLCDFILNKQQQGTSFTTANLFDATKSEFILGDKIVSSYTGLSLDKKFVSDIFNKKPAGIRIPMPLTRQQNLELVLAAEQINSSSDFSFGTITDHIKTKTSADQGLHYRGYIAGDSSSIACISIFKNGEVTGVFANSNGNFIIGRMKNSDDRYVVYKSSDMLIQPRYQCATSELTYPSLTTANNNALDKAATAPPPPPVVCKKVRVYWEADYNLYSNNLNSDLVRTQNYLTGLFNMVATIYQNEGIILELSKTFVWTSPSPYGNANSTAVLNSFKSYWNAQGDNYDGDLAHLIAGGPSNNGGLSYILNFDQCNRPYTYGYSNVYANYQAYPNYSWDAQVVSHETGHNLGSNHTHWCGWNTGAGNGCGAIDNCFALESGSGCSTCGSTTDINAAPAGFKGTIMSYCYLLNGVGVSFVNGFGPLPQAVIRRNVSGATCFTSRNLWTGDINTAWENTGNWSCGSLPDANTDVIINSGLTNYPVVNGVAACRSIKQLAGSSVKVNGNSYLFIYGKPGD